MNDEELAILAKYEANRQWLIGFYRKHNPELLSDVDSTLRRWQGKEQELFAQLVEKYDKTVEDEYNVVVNTLKTAYKTKIKPIEEAYRFDLFFSP